MTKNQFVQEVTNWSELIDFCWINDFDFCSDVVSADDRDELICDHIRDFICGHFSWHELFLLLDQESSNMEFEYYRCNGILDFDGLEQEDFEWTLENVIRQLDAANWWDSEDPDDKQTVAEAWQESGISLEALLQVN